MSFSLRILTVMLLAGISISFAVVDKKLCGHWVSEKSFLDASRGDTLKYDRVTYDYDLYTWGTGIISGLEFKPDGHFELHQNVMCSTESPTLTFEGEWQRLIDSTIHITAPGRHGHYLEVIHLDNKELVLIKR